MSNDSKPAQKRIDQLFSGPGGRADDWRDLVEAAKAWAQGGVVRNTTPRWPTFR